MNINVKYSFIKGMPAKNLIIQKLSYWEKDKVEKGEYDKDDATNIDLCTLSKLELVTLEKLLVEYNAPKKIVSTVQNWIENINDPSNAVITSLQGLEKMLRQAIKSSNLKWIMYRNKDGNFIPMAVSEIKYHGRSRDDEALLTVELYSMRLDSGSWYDDDKELKLKKVLKRVHFYNSDLFGEDEYYSNVELEEDETDDEDSPKKSKKKKNTSKDVTLLDVLNNKYLTLVTKKYIEEYNQNINQYNSISKEIGQVYTGTGKAYMIAEGKRSYSNWSYLNEEDKVSKLVIDSIRTKEDSESVSSKDFGTLQVPIEPYVLTYNLSMYCYASVHVSNLEKYKFNKDLLEKLIISDNKKKLLNSLIESKNNFVDIIQGKSGGMVILCSGLPGTGKTLTAEIYSEIMEKPLYSIQSSQLGVNVEDIEKNLNNVLRRSDKWNAVLLIDEADCYVYKRNNEILQNCIVGTFLRLLEYYNGILFLTTNRPEIVDDAIMSRVTAHIKYDYPSKGDTFKLWSVLSKNFNKKIDMVTVNKIWDAYEPICGRDIRNLLKMLSKYNPKEMDVKFEMIQELKEFIPFLKERDVTK